MSFFRIKPFLSVILTLIVSSLFGQHYWTDLTSDQVPKSIMDKPTFSIDQYRILQTNPKALSAHYTKASARNIQSKNLENGLRIHLPLPDGTYQSFDIVSVSSMHTELANQFPSIKSYAGVGVDDPGATVRITKIEKGIYIQVLSDNHPTVYINPIQESSDQYYFSYYKEDLQNPNTPFHCQLNEELDQLLDVKNIKAAGDCQLRTYRLAMACTGEYAQFHGGTVSAAMSAIVVTMDRVNGIYERDLAITMELIPNNNLIIYTDSNTDPYTNNNGVTMLGQNQSNIDNIIGSANYDIGHVVSTGGGGVATLGVPCANGSKARGVTGLGSPVGDPFDVDYVAHEIGHQFGATHTFNNSCSGNRTNSTAFEPGSGNTIMAYAGICSPNVQNNSDDHFHAGSITQISNYVINSTGNSCPVKTPLNNNPPTIQAIQDYVIPYGTPFVLTANASDIDGDMLTYCWEQMDNEIATMPPVSTSTGGPLFRSNPPTSSPKRYFPNLTDLTNNVSPTWEVLPTVNRDMNFRVTVRDNAPGGGCTVEENVKVTANQIFISPFSLIEPSNGDEIWTVDANETVTWNVALTNITPINCQNVDILLSLDGGFTYPIILATSVPNDGSQMITVPAVNSTMARVMVFCSDNIFFNISNENFDIIGGTPGCTDMNAHNYDATADVDDGSCETCSDMVLNGDETDVDCGGSLCAPCTGCTDQSAHNFDLNAGFDDGSCETCTDMILNGDEVGIDCGGSLCAPCSGCTDSMSHNFDATALSDDGSCETCVDGIQNGDESGVDCGGSNSNCQDCPCTEQDLLYTGPYNFPNSTNKHVNDWIQLDGSAGSIQLLNSLNTTLRAGNYIEILPEFDIMLGAEMLLDIEPCNSNGLPFQSNKPLKK